MATSVVQAVGQQAFGAVSQAAAQAVGAAEQGGQATRLRHSRYWGKSTPQWRRRKAPLPVRRTRRNP